MADRVMRSAGPFSPITPAQRQLSRKCSACEQEETGNILQPKAAPTATRQTTAPPVASDVVRTPGRALDAESRAFFEPRFGIDFGRVRIHHDAAAATAAAAVSARAYTVGNHIVFASGQFAPTTDSGRALLAHELTHVLQQRSALRLQKQKQVAKPATEKDERQFVQDTIQFLHDSVQHFQLARIDDATLDRVLNSWYSMVVRQEKIVDTDLHGDAALKAQLHAAYISALRVLVTRYAGTAHKSEADLYRINSGRIPLWAQPHPSHLEPGITTPIPDDVPVTHARGSVQFSLGGFDVVVSPDTRAARLNTPGAAGETRPHIHFSGIHYHATGPHGRVTSFTGPSKPILTVSTAYLRGANPAGPSGYGRGTTAEDKAGANVTPESQSLAFHESRHGQEALDFIRSNPPPAFTGKVGDSVADFEKAMSTWTRAVADYAKRMDAVDSSHVHCVGVTIDQAHAASAPPGTRIVKECP